MKLGVFWQHLGNSVGYYPKLAKVTGGVMASVFFCQLFQWQSQLSDRAEWLRLTVDEIENETGLSPVEQELARRELVKRSLIKERLVSDRSDILEFWADIDALEEKLKECWEQNTAAHSHRPNPKKSFQRSSLSKVDLETNQNNFYSKKTTETFGEGVTPVQLEQKTFLDSQKSSLHGDRHSDAESSGAAFNSSSIHAPVEVIDNTHPPTRTVKTDKFFPVRRQPIAVKVTPNYQFSGPWESREQFEAFQRALWNYFKKQGIDNPSGWVFNIIDGLTKGLVSPFWDEFVAGIPLGETQKIKRDWEIESGVPYPAFEEERIQYYLHKGEPLEAALAKARSDLRDPVLGKDLWDGFLRKCDRMADEAIKAKQLGVSVPYLPSSFTNKPQITKQSVINKLSAIAPQLSLASSSSDSPANQGSEPNKLEDKGSDSLSDVPAISALQKAYKTAIGRTLVEKQIAEHPEWGYGIVDGQVVDLFPF